MAARDADGWREQQQREGVCRVLGCARQDGDGAGGGSRTNDRGRGPRS